MSAWANYFQAMAEAHRANAKAARLDPCYTAAEREERGQFYDGLAAECDRMAAEEEARA